MFVRRPIRISPTLQRQLFWTLIGLGHFPGLWSAWRALDFENGVAAGLSGGSVGRLLGLTLTLIFISLKIRDVKFLRLCPGRRSVIAGCLVVALLHVDVIRPSGESSVIPDVTMLAATVWIAASPARVRERLLNCLTPVHPKRGPSDLTRQFASTAWLDAARPHCWLLSRALYLLRAPPV